MKDGPGSPQWGEKLLTRKMFGKKRILLTIIYHLVSNLTWTAVLVSVLMLWQTPKNNNLKMDRVILLQRFQLMDISFCHSWAVGRQSIMMGANGNPGLVMSRQQGGRESNHKDQAGKDTAFKNLLPPSHFL